MNYLRFILVLLVILGTNSAAIYKSHARLHVNENGGYFTIFPFKKKSPKLAHAVIPWCPVTLIRFFHLLKFLRIFPPE